MKQAWKDYLDLSKRSNQIRNLTASAALYIPGVLLRGSNLSSWKDFLVRLLILGGPADQLYFNITERMPLSGIVLIIGILLGITTLIGILGNISVCLVVFWNRSMRTQLHLLLVNLAIADVGMSASCMPFAVATVLFHEQVKVKRNGESVNKAP